MIYDGQGWLQRYRSLYDKLNELMDEYEYLHPTKKRPPDASFIGSSPAIVKIKKEIFQVAKSNANLLIEGETGVGKEVVANEVFRASNRSGKRFVKLNCAALPQELIESELFGYAEGAFTGARRSGKAGMFELADTGMILLDEIGDMPLPMQAKLLRVLQDGSFRSLGARKVKTVNVKIIAATNVEPLQAIQSHQLRQDIYYRLSMMSIHIPPLRERRRDIASFVSCYVAKHNQTFHKQVQRVSEELVQRLEQYDWPGNVRQLEQVIVYGMSRVESGRITLELQDVEERLREMSFGVSARPAPGSAPPPGAGLAGGSLRDAVHSYERSLIAQALEEARGKLTAAAGLLKIPRQTLQRKIKQYGLDEETP